MSICQSGINSNIRPAAVLIEVNKQHPLIQLGQVIQWQELSNLVIEDLKKTLTGKWWVGRKLKLRIHLGVYLLQHLFNKTDRQIEYDVKDNAAYRIFCGFGVVDHWHIPDHTKIEKFRSRLGEETQKRLANHVAHHAVKMGFGDPEDFDIDSTVQEANMTYPADSILLKKLGGLCNKVAHFFNKTVICITTPLQVNMKKISSTARGYFFLAKNSTKDIKNKKLSDLLSVVSKEIKPVIEVCEHLSPEQIKKMPWNYKRAINQILELARQYLKDVRFFLVKGCILPTKRLSFHLEKVACFMKGKPGKKYQFGRLFQLGRIGGNFFVVGKCSSIQMPDKSSVKPMVKEHENLFGKRKIKSASADKGYYSNKNERLLLKKGVEEIGIQRPCNIKKDPPRPLSKEIQEKLANRRSGIEPLIGHIKHNAQLGRSRMKSDKAIECSGYTSVLGFNMRQLIRHQRGKMERKIA